MSAVPFKNIIRIVIYYAFYAYTLYIIQCEKVWSAGSFANIQNKNVNEVDINIYWTFIII